MAERLGIGAWSFEVNENWAKIPDEIVLGDCAAVGVDSNDNVYAFNRGDHPVAVFDKDGKLLRTWGEGVFPRPHGFHVAPDDTIWLTDDGDHSVRHCTLDGKVLLTLGIPGKPAPYMSGGPFHRWTHTCGASRSIAAPIPRCRRRATISTSPTATATPASTNTRLAANCWRRG